MATIIIKIQLLLNGEMDNQYANPSSEMAETQHVNVVRILLCEAGRRQGRSFWEPKGASHSERYSEHGAAEIRF